MVDRLRQGLAAVSRAVTAFSETTPDYDLLLSTVVRSVAEVLHDTCIVTLISEDGTTVTPVAMHDESRAVMAAFGAMLQRPRGLTDTLVAVVATGGTLFMPHVDLAALRVRAPSANLDFIASTKVSGLIVVPLKARGQLIGALTIMRHRSELPALDDVDLEIATQLANHASLALANARMFQALAHSEELRRTDARAREATMFLDAIIENIPDMVFLKDADKLAFVRFNRAGEDLLGIPRTDLIGKSDFDFFPPSEAEFFVAKDRETLRNRTLVEIAEEPIQTRHGPRWLHTKKVPILDANGEPRFLLGISHDITTRKQDTAALQLAKEAAEAAGLELEAFSYSVAHDLRAPLRSIDSFGLALLEDFGPELGEIGGRHLQRIRSAAQRMSVLIDELLELSRVTRAEINTQPVDLAELGQTAIAALRRAEPERSVEITFADRVAAVGDPKLLAIALDNLLSNAWKFTARREHARIELGCRLDDSKPIYFVRDNGVGFDMAYAQNLFGAFQRLHSAVDFPGTGIGLATVRRIIGRHGGRTWAESSVDGGATFYFTLDE